MKSIIQSISIMLFIVTVFSTCDYEEDKSGKSNDGPYRLLSVNVTGGITDTNSETYTYNEDGYLTTLIKKDNTGDTVSMTSYQYNDKGEAVQEITTQNAITTITVNEYIEGQKSHSETVDQNQIILNQVDYFYDNRGFLIKKEVKDASGVVTGTVTFSYEQESVKGIGKELSEYTLLSQ